MRNFTGIMKSFTLNSMRGKQNLSRLYLCDGDFVYEGLRFRFASTTMRTPEEAVLYVAIPTGTIPNFAPEEVVVCADFLLRILAPPLNALSAAWQNDSKPASEKGAVAAQCCTAQVMRRSGCLWSAERDAFLLKLFLRFPLQSGTWINAKEGIKTVQATLQCILAGLRGFDRDALLRHRRTYADQLAVRAWMRETGTVAFVADGSILPRAGGTDQPADNAIPFTSPDTLRAIVPLPGGRSISGMALRQGITVITGGGYSGKSTLLDALEMGIYHHIPGDGREFCLSEPTALKVCAEDGRPVQNLDLSPFFRSLPGDADLTDFTTLRASGSVSQAANILEAVCGGCRLLLIDEDRSATNFMIRDRQMRQIVRREPIIPFTDRVRSLTQDEGISTILVIGGSSEYLAYADRVILMEDFIAHDITTRITALDLPTPTSELTPAVWPHLRRVVPRETNQPFLYFRAVKTKNEKKIILDEYSADITALTALTSGDQLNTLSCLAEGLLTDSAADGAELTEKLAQLLAHNFTAGQIRVNSLLPASANRQYAEVRPIDAVCCINRMRGISFKR